MGTGDDGRDIVIVAPLVLETATKWSVRLSVVVAVYLLTLIRRPPVVAKLFPERAPIEVTAAPLTVSAVAVISPVRVEMFAVEARPAPEIAPVDDKPPMPTTARLQVITTPLVVRAL